MSANHFTSRDHESLPAGWRWARLGDVITRMLNGTSTTQNTERKGLPVTRIETISSGSINLDRVGWIDSTENSLERYFLRAGDILFSQQHGETGQLRDI